MVRRKDLAVKAYGRADAERAAKIARRSQILHDAGVATPPASYDPVDNELRFPWIAGPTGRDMFLRRGIAASPEDLAARTDFFERALEPLAKLHRIPPDTVDVPALDPWRLVVSRLAGTAPGPVPISATVLRKAEKCRAALQQNLAPAERNVHAVLHGDLHLGQWIFEHETGRAWLVDLDDICRGPPEADLGNLAAYLITSPDLYAGSLDTGFCVLAEVLAGVYRNLAEGPPDAGRIAIHGAVALVRRALKLSERGGPDALALDALNVSERLGA